MLVHFNSDSKLLSYYQLSCFARTHVRRYPSTERRHRSRWPGTQLHHAPASRFVEGARSEDFENVTLCIKSYLLRNIGCGLRSVRNGGGDRRRRLALLAARSTMLTRSRSHRTIAMIRPHAAAAASDVSEVSSARPRRSSLSWTKKVAR